jgi:LuxR family maltose regulon positive regulatory protein
LQPDGGAIAEKRGGLRFLRSAKLRPPLFHLAVVERSRLLARLAQTRARPVVVLCAAAGFGKTLVALELTAADPRPSGWLTLDESDADPVALLDDLVLALDRLEPVDAEVRALLDRRAPRVEQEILPLLADDLARREPFLLVLDDVELVTAPGALAILSFLVESLPPGSQVVLATRTEPHVQLGRLRAADDVVELRAGDLALDVEETRALLATSGVELGLDEAADVRDRFEGWPAGIALAMFSRASDEAPDPFDAVSVGPSAEIAGYLLEEGLEQQPERVQQFLLASSCMRRMSPELCDCALGIDGSAAILKRLERESLFLVPLDRNGRWYRYHNLFRELLQAESRRRDPDGRTDMLLRAAAWHERNGDPEEAFEYAHAAGDLASAGRIILRHGDSLVASGRVATVATWLGRCSAQELASDPQLALAAAWGALLTGDAGAAQQFGAVAATGVENGGANGSSPPENGSSPDGATSFRSAVANFRGTLAPDGVGQMLEDGLEVCAAEGPAGTRWALDGWRTVGTAHLLAGRTDEAIAAFAEVLRLTRDQPELDYITINCLGYSALAAADADDWQRARKWAREAHATAVERHLDHVVQSVAPYTAHATVLEHDGLLPQSEAALHNALRLLPMVHAVRWWEADIAIRCAEVQLGLGDLDRTLELADLARSAIRHYPDAGLLPQRLRSLEQRSQGGAQLGLTPSELRLVPFLPSHLSLQEISDRVYLSRATVKTHTLSVYRKLDVQTRSAAVDRLEQLGFFRSAARWQSAVLDEARRHPARV